MAATTLQEFLVSVRYTVDSASQQSFLQGLARGALSAKGLALELALLTGALVKLSVSLAEAGEKLYWMSMRMGSSVQDIRDISFAMSNLGVSSDEAKQSMASLAEWTARYGSAGTAYLRMLGVTATDTAEQYKQLGEVLRARGGTLEFMHGTPAQQQQFSMARALAESFGINLQTMLAMTSGEMERFEKISDDVYAAVGLGTIELQKQAAALSHEYMNAWRSVELEFRAVRDAFTAELLKQLTPVMKELFDIIKANLPLITALVKGAADVIALFLGTLTTLLEIGSHIIHGLQQLYQLFEQLPEVVRYAAEALIALGAAMMMSPIGWIIAGLTTLVLLLDDLATWERGGISHFNWSWFDNFKDFNVTIAGVKVDLADIALAMASIAASFVILRGGAGLAAILGIGAGAGAGAGAAGAAGATAATAGAAGAGSFASRVIPRIGFLAVAGFIANEFWGKAKEEGWDPGAAGHSPVAFGEKWGAEFRDWIKGAFVPSAHAETTTGGGGGSTLPAISGTGDQAPLVTDLPGTLGDYGTRANNPGNMNYADWEGASGRFEYTDRQTGGAHTMAVFRTMQEGIAAHVRLMERNQEKYGHTLAGALHGWAELPYVGKLGMDPNAQFDVAETVRTHPEIMEKLLEAQYGREGRAISSGAVTPEIIMQALQGVQRATKPGGASDRAYGGGPAGAGADGGDTNVTLHQSTSIHVDGSASPHETGAHVAQQQGRVNEAMVRNAANVLR